MYGHKLHFQVHHALFQVQVPDLCTIADCARLHITGVQRFYISTYKLNSYTLSPSLSFNRAITSALFG